MNSFEVLSFTREVLSELGFSHIILSVNHRLTVTAGRVIFKRYFPVKTMPDGTKNHYHTLELSGKYMEVMNQSEMLETVLHEIGHIMTPLNAPSHGALWAENVRSIGGNPTTYVPKEYASPVTKYTLSCTQVGCNFTSGLTRKTRYMFDYSCPDCNKKHNKGKHSTDHILRVVKNY